MKSDTLKMKQSFKSSFTFPCFGVGIVSVCSTVCLLLLLFSFEIQLVSLVCDDSASRYWFRTGNETSPLLPVKSLLTGLCAGRSLGWRNISSLLLHVPHLSSSCACKYSYPLAGVVALPVCWTSDLSSSQSWEVCIAGWETSLAVSAIVLLEEGGRGGEVQFCSFPNVGRGVIVPSSHPFNFGGTVFPHG